jgi:PAS domain S-box-containing protein
MDVLTGNRADVPFALIYLMHDDGAARLTAWTGDVRAEESAPLEILPEQMAASWPVSAVASSQVPAFVYPLAERFGRVADGPWPEPPSSAMVLPLVQRGVERGVGAIVLGISSRRHFDEEYREWFELVAGQVSASISNARAVEEERRRAEALAEIDRAKTTFFSNVSHELRTPLTLIMGPVEDALADTSASPARRESLDIAHRNGLRLLRLVNSLLDFSRIEAGRVHASYTPTDLSRLTVDLASVFRAAMEKAGLHFAVDCPPLPEPVYVDVDMWEKVVLNLLSNAFKYTFDGGIAVALQPRGDHAELIVRDTGVGVPEDELPHLFDRFHRVEGVHGRTHEGTGIGLALVQELVKLHGGRVAVESAPGNGTAFTVSVPFGRAHLPPERVETAPAAASTGIGATAFVEEALRWLPGEPLDSLGAADTGSDETPEAAARVSSTHGARIVLADDNADMRDYVSRLLRPYWRVEATVDGQAALHAIRRETPDIVLADVMMPRLDGFGLLRALRDDAVLRHVPVIFLSARAGEESRVEGMHAGADDYLVKPFSARELIARVGSALQLAQVRREGERRLFEVNQDLRHRVAELEALLNVIPVGIGIALDRECRTIHVNPAFAATLGVSPDANASMTAPDSERPTSFRVLDVNGREIPGEQLPMQVAAREGRPVMESELDVVQPDGRVVRVLEYAVPLFDERHEPRGCVGAFVDITERRRAEQRDQFLVRLDDAIRVLADPIAIMSAAAKLLGSHLRVSRCAYADVEEDSDHFTIPSEYVADGADASLTGWWVLSAFGERAASQLRQGRTLVVRDYVKELPGDAGAFAALGVRATICAAQVREGRLTALMMIHSNAPREWTLDDVQLVELVANRCWESIERARVMRVLAASEARFRQLADAIPQLVWMTRPDGGVIYLNERYREYAGVALDDLYEWGWQRIVHDDDWPGTLERWTDAIRTGEAVDLKLRYRRADGEWRWHLVRGVPVRDDRRRIMRWVGACTDIHETETQEQDARFLSELGELIRTSDDADSLMATAGALIGRHVGAARCCFAEIDEAAGRWRVLSDYCLEPSTEEETPDTDYPPGVLEVLRRGRVYSVADRADDPLGLRAHVIVPFWSDGRWAMSRITSAAEPRTWEAREIALLETASERVWNAVKKLKADAARREVEQERDQLLVRAETGRAQAELANRLKDEFLATLSHELRTPLNAVLGWAHMLRSGNLRPDVTEKALASLERNAMAQAQLVDDLLDVSRIISGKLQMQSAAVDLALVIREAVDTVRPAAVSKRVRLRTATDSRRRLLVTGDADRLRQIVWNLLSNAIKFTPPRGRVQVTLARDGVEAVIAVNDSGQGIDPEFLPFVFERFRQADGTATRRHGGLGLGLAIVRHLTEAHGGTISAESEGPDRGSTFTVRLPVRGARSAGSSKAREVRMIAQTILEGARILVVDDEADARELIRTVLQRQGGDVTLAASAGEALHAIEAHAFDVIVADIGMPDQDGYSLIQAVRSMPPPAGRMPAVAVTAYAGDVERERVLAAGYDRHLPKPIEPELLVAAVGSVGRGGRRVARRARPQRPKPRRQTRNRR